MIMPPKSAPARRNVDAAAALKPVARKSFTSISGRSANHAWRTKSATSTAPATIGTHAIGAVMPPWLSVSESPKTIPATPGERSSSPVQSRRPASARPGGLREHAHADRHDHAAAEALQHAEEDQRPGRPREAAQGRAEAEQGDRHHPDALRPQALGRPPRQW